MTNTSGPKVKSLRDLSQEVRPERDLWPQIEARLRAESPAPAGSVGLLRAPWRRIAALAAAIVAVAAGIAVDRVLLHGAGSPLGAASLSNSAAVPVAYLSDPRYVQARAALMSSLSTRLAALPPDSRAHVLASLATIHRSMLDIQTALGRDPGNALLQELFVDTCQDEMRVLSAVQTDDHNET